MDIFNSDMNINPDAVESAEQLLGWNLRVPSSVARKKGVARWQEVVSVEGVTNEDAPGQNGEQRRLLTVKTKVLPAVGLDPENVGRPFNIRLRINFGLAQGKSGTLGNGDQKTENFMNAMSLKKLKQLILASGLDLAQGLQQLPVLFPDENTLSPLVGMKFYIGVSDNEGKKAPNGQNNQEADSILPVPAGMA